MKTSNAAANNIAYAIPFETLIFTAEMKNYIGRSTLRGLFISVTMITIMIAAFLLFLQTEHFIPKAPVITGSGPIIITGNNNTDKDIIISQTIPKSEIVLGIKDRAGNPVPVPDAVISPDAGEFAKLSDLSKAMHESGNTLGNPFSFSGKDGIEIPKQANVQTVTKEEEEVMESVDQLPLVDLEKLQKLVVYPKLAKDARVEGRVTVGVLVSKTGLALKYTILDSENELLNDAALSAVKAYGKYLPAIQANSPVACWLYIPMQFRLK